MAIFKENWQNGFSIDLDGHSSLADLGKATNWAAVSEGITQVTPSAQETNDKTAYWPDQGLQSTDTTGKAIQFAFTGHRVEGDPAQEFIASKFISIGGSLKTLAQWVDPQGNVVVFVGVITTPVPFGGNANVKQTFSFTLAADGMMWQIPAGSSVAVLPDGTTKPLPEGYKIPGTVVPNTDPTTPTAPVA